MAYKIGAIYKLNSPSDGYDGTNIARYPIGLPVVLQKVVANEKNEIEKFVVTEPHGYTVEFPASWVWRMGMDVDIFQKGLEQLRSGEKLLLEPFETVEIAKKEWYKYTHEEENRWYLDKVRKQFDHDSYMDWECGVGISEMKLLLSVADDVLPDDLSQDKVDAIMDMALMILSGDDPDWSSEVSSKYLREIAYNVLEAVKTMLTVDYIVKSGGHWDRKHKIFRLDEFYVDMKTKKCSQCGEVCRGKHKCKEGS